MVAPPPPLPPPAAMGKPALRRAARAQRDAFAAHTSTRIAPTGPWAGLMRHGQTVASYIPLGSEADPTPLVDAARAAGCHIALPHVTSRAAPMRFLHWADGAPLDAGPFGLRQPPADAPVATPDIILVPLVAFTRAGVRLGQGAGHYDRALSTLPHALRVGVALSIQQWAELPCDPWDMPLHAIITQQEWIAI
ncbi:MAG: 5-formyltetrahydrofolate cyclo-ligase [Sphingopyxis sp.]